MARTDWRGLPGAALAAGALLCACCAPSFSALSAPRAATPHRAQPVWERGAASTTGLICTPAFAAFFTVAVAAAAVRGRKVAASRIARRFADDSAETSGIRGGAMEAALREFIGANFSKAAKAYSTYYVRVEVVDPPEAAFSERQATGGDEGVQPEAAAPVRKGWRRLNSELANSRLALLASLGSEMSSGGTGPLAEGGGPLRAGVARRAAERDAKASASDEERFDRFDDWDDEMADVEVFDPSEQIGAMPPLGYFDPLGFSKVGDEEAFRQYRVYEIKHGRLAMMATVGAVVQHYIKLPGFEAMRNNSLGSQFAEMFKAPGIYWTTLFLPMILVLEVGLWVDLPEKNPGDFGDPLGIGMYDKETREKELNNGRFAMFAAAGILAAQATTGLDGVEQIETVFGLR